MVNNDTLIERLQDDDVADLLAELTTGAWRKLYPDDDLSAWVVDNLYRLFDFGEYHRIELDGVDFAALRDWANAESEG